MAKGFSTSTAFLNLFRKNDLFLLLLLLASLSLNVYLGWSVKRLSFAPAKPPDAPKLSAGVTVEPITAATLNGEQETIRYADSDKPTVFYVFSPTCVWCERNTKNINAIAGSKADSFRFIGLSLDDQNLTKYVEAHHMSFPVYKGVSQESVQMLGLGPTPQTIVISPDGHVLKNWSGAYSASVQPQVEEFFNVRLPGLVALK